VGARHFWGPDMRPAKTFIDGARWVVVPDWLRELRRAATDRNRQRRKDRTSMVAPALARAVDMPARRAAHARHVALRLDGRCEDRRGLVTHPYAVVARERYDRVAAPLAIETRDPFLDLRVLRFVLSLPPDQIERDGWPKIVLRRAMAGLLPDAVRWRVGKEHLGWQFEEALAARWLACARPDWEKAIAPFVRPDLVTPSDCRRTDTIAVESRLVSSYLRRWIVYARSVLNSRQEKNEKSHH